MSTSANNLILLALAILIPLLLLITKKYHLLLGWVCLTFFIQLFDTSTLTNLPAGRIVGLMYLPKALMDLREWSKFSPVKAWLLNYSYLVILAFLFGWLWPWPDTTFMRPFSLTSEGRSVIYTIRLISDLSLAIFIANQIRSVETVFTIVRLMVIGSTISALVGILYMATGFDLAYEINGFENDLLVAGRAHGLSAEPRDLGLSCAYGIMFLLIGKERIFRLWLLMLVINLIGLFGSSSTSAVALLAGGIVTGWFFFSNRTRGAILVLILIVAFLGMTAQVFFTNQFEVILHTMQARLDPAVKLAGIPPGTFGQEIAYRLDVFDASAMLFLLDQPLYALIGTGPGLVSLPGSLYVPPGLYSAIWTPDVGINSPPFHGILLEISNSGLLGILLWAFQIVICWRALRWLAQNSQSPILRDYWDIAWGVFLIGSIFYLIQVSISPVWSVFLGIGWFAVRLAYEQGYNMKKQELDHIDTSAAMISPQYRVNMSRR